MHISSNKKFHTGTQYDNVDCDVVREKLEQGLLFPSHVRIGDQAMDIFTKALHGLKAAKLGLININIPT